MSARIRTIKPEFFDSPHTAKASAVARLAYIGAWCWADDTGRGTFNPKELEGFIFPNDDIATLSRGEFTDFGGVWRQVAATFGLIVYEVDGRSYYQIPSWDKHQRVRQGRGSRFPGPDSPNAHVLNGSRGHGEEWPQMAATCRQSPPGTGEQGNRGTGEQGSTAAEAAAPPRLDVDQHSPNAHVLNGSRGHGEEWPQMAATCRQSPPGTGEQGNRGTGEQGSTAAKAAATPRLDVDQLCDELAASVARRSEKRKPRITKAWKDEARRLLDVDEVPLDHALKAITWAENNQFWQSVILTPKALRKHYDQMLIQSRQPQRRTQADLLHDMVQRNTPTNTDTSPVALIERQAS